MYWLSESGFKLTSSLKWEDLVWMLIYASHRLCDLEMTPALNAILSSSDLPASRVAAKIDGKCWNAE